MRNVTRKTRKHSKLSALAFVVLFIVSMLGIVLWRLPSVQVMSVQSGSMTPAIKKGDAVVLQTVKKSDLSVGDVVSFRSPADQRIIITHRITAVEPNWNLIITKGDNVDRADKPVPMSAVIGRVNTRIRYGGTALDFLRSPAGLIASVYVPAAIIILSELSRLVRAYNKPTYRLVTYAKH